MQNQQDSEVHSGGTGGLQSVTTNNIQNHRSSMDTAMMKNHKRKKLSGAHSPDTNSMQHSELRKSRRALNESVSPKMLPSIKQKFVRPRNRSMKSGEKPDWNSRFHVDGTCNYTSLHPYYKVLKLRIIFFCSNTSISHRKRHPTQSIEWLEEGESWVVCLGRKSQVPPRIVSR